MYLQVHGWQRVPTGPSNDCQRCSYGNNDFHCCSEGRNDCHSCTANVVIGITAVTVMAGVTGVVTVLAVVTEK